MTIQFNKASPRHDIFTLLSIIDYRRMLISNALWWHTMFMEFIVVGWLVLELTDSPWQLALVGFCRSLPLLLFGFFAGPITDCLGRRTIIVSAQTTTLCAYASIALLLWNESLAVWHLVLASFVLGLSWALDFPARRALIPDLVGKERTVSALLTESLAQGLTRMLGPFIAGWLIDVFGPFGCFLYMVVAATCTLSILHTLSKQPIPRTNMRPDASPWTLIGQGLRYVRQNQPILAVLLITFVMNLLIFPYITLLPVFARDILKQGPIGLGLLGTGTGVGSFIGLLLISRLRHKVNNGTIFAVGTLFQCLALAAFALSQLYTLSWAMLLLSGIGQSCFVIMQSSIILLAASDEMRSRAMGMVVLAIGADPLGKLQTGALAENFGAPIALGTQATMAAIVIGLIALFLPELRQPPTGAKLNNNF